MDWKRSNLFPNYEISEFGDVRRYTRSKDGRDPGSIVNSYLKAGYKRFNLYRGAKVHGVKAARLVIEAFAGPRPFEGACVCHNDGQKKNDHFTNLRWGTMAQNMADREIHGTTSRGEKHSLACRGIG